MSEPIWEVDLHGWPDCTSQSLQVLRHADAELRADVFAVERDLGKARVLVHGDCIGLTRAGFEDDPLSAELSRVSFQGVHDLPSDAAAADGGVDVHAFDLGDAGFDRSHGAAADGFTGQIGNKKRAAAFGDFFRIEAKEVRAVFGVDGFELGVEGLD